MDSDEPKQPAVDVSAGQQLRQAREKHGLSQKDVADAQHLRVSIIQSIEDGKYEQIDSELFLKGYVRAYAKQVGADADALIATLDLELEPLRRERAKQEQENPLVDIERRRLKKRRIAKALGVLVILGAIAVAVWTLVIEPRVATEPAPEASANQEQSEAAVVNETDEALPESSEANATEASEENVGQDLVQSEPGIAETDTAPGVGAGSEEPSEPAVESAVESADPQVALQDYPEPASGGPESIEEASGAPQEVTEDIAAPEPVVTIEPAVQPDPVFEESAQPDAVAAPTELTMSFVSDCWVQVTDSSGARLVASLQRNGDEINVSGRAPLNVVIGAVDAVESVRFGGESVDLSSFRVVNNRTEFTLTL
jgi:cytoskeleton protein RodZ